MSKVTDKRWKGFKLDWLEIADMDSESVEYKALTQQQVSILLSLLEYQKWETRWENLGMSKNELESFIGDLEYRLMRNEVTMATQAEITAAICDGLECFTESWAKRYLSGDGLNFSVGDDGTITIGGGTDGLPSSPTDDPLTIIDEAASARMGGSIAVGKGIELYLDKVDSYYGATNGAPTTPLATAQAQLKIYFPCDGALMDLAIATYYTYRNSNARIIFDGTASFYQYLYCKGSDLRAFLQWIVDLSGYAAAKVSMVNDLMTPLLPEFFTDYYTQGLELPSTTYLEASCVPSPTETIYLLALGTTYNGQQAWKNNHRLLFTVENYFTDNLGNIVDFWWYDAVGATLPVNRIATVSIQLGTGITKPTINQVPYASGHKYQFTIDTPAAAGSVAITLPSTGMTAPVTPSVAGVGIKVTIQDLGEYSV